MNYKKKLTSVALLIGIILLNGCAYFKRPPTFEPIAKEKRKTELLQIDNWTINGAISITYNKKRDMARFKWIQKQNEYMINISGPLNINSVRIFGNSDNVELWRTNKKRIKAKTPEQLTKDQFGWQLPVSNIRYWILASPVPNRSTELTQFDQYGHLIDLIQDGWQIKYSEFQPQVGKNIDLPKTIVLKNKDLAIKLRILYCALG